MNHEVFSDRTSLQRYYVGQVMIGLLAGGQLRSDHGAANIEGVTQEAFAIADAMVAKAFANTPKSSTPDF